jgi:hypothetical protein
MCGRREEGKIYRVKIRREIVPVIEPLDVVKVCLVEEWVPPAGIDTIRQLILHQRSQYTDTHIDQHANPRARKVPPLIRANLTFLHVGSVFPSLALSRARKLAP